VIRCKRAAAGALLAVIFCAPAAAAQFAFAAFGDVPYTPAEELQLVSMIAEMNREPLAFVMHVGDFKSGHIECSDEVFLQRREWFGLSHHPFVFIPGDNEWVDCRRAYWARRDPVERLGKLRELFFANDATLGQRVLKVERQTRRGHPEHLRWTIEDVVFATLNVPGHDNNARMPQESAPRTAALLEWMREAFSLARARNHAAVVLGVQANLWSGNAAYRPILAALADEAQRYKGAVLVVHGDTHWYRFDQPLVDPSSGNRIENVTRLEVHGSPFVNWVHVSVSVENGRVRFAAIPGSDLRARER
jgi:hypothetical protein